MVPKPNRPYIYKKKEYTLQIIKKKVNQFNKFYAFYTIIYEDACSNIWNVNLTTERKKKNAKVVEYSQDGIIVIS